MGVAGPPPACSDDNGNVNGDSARDLSDAVYLLAWLFQGGPFPGSFCATPGPKEVGCARENGNTNGDAARDLSDVIYLLAWLFQGGPAPVLFCGGSPPEICDDLGGDEDGDGLTDCDDPDCAGMGPGPCPAAETCDNDEDDDEDGATDCADCDCVDDPACPPTSCPAIAPDCQSLTALGFTFAGENPTTFLDEYTHDQTGIRFVHLPGGTVNMGAQDVAPGDPNFDPGAEASEDDLPADDPNDGNGRAHAVTLGPFLIAQSEVTQAQYEAVMGPTTFGFDGDDLPVETVTWNQLHEIKRFDGQGGFTGVDGFLERTCLSLPTEAQWEYACRAGEEGPISGDGVLDNMGWHVGNSGGATHAVMGKTANQFGLFDMHGNVRELCEDVFDADFYSEATAAGPDPLRGCTPGSICGLNRVVRRGGGYNNSAGDCRSASRSDFSVGGAEDEVGFRLVFTVPRCAETNCGDGVDNDLDHATDCDDSDCATDPGCDDNCGAQPAPIDGFTLLGCNAQGFYEFEHDQTGIICVQLPGGTFDMGAHDQAPGDPNFDLDAEDDEDDLPNPDLGTGRAHQVTLSPFLIGKYEVTQCQWEARMDTNPSFFSGDPGDGDRPVDSATWNEVHGGFFLGRPGFLERTCPPLSLPTEAQWEYAARAGQGAPISGNGILDDMGWHLDHIAPWFHDDSGACKGRETHPVGQRQANQFGLFDMHGNVEEFCEDVSDPDFYSEVAAAGPDPFRDCRPDPDDITECGKSVRITRGGSWYGSAGEARSSNRAGYARQGDRFEWVGFRVAFPLP